jgi:hypothetical protein
MAVIVSLLRIAVAPVSIDKTAVRISDSRREKQKPRKPQERK